MALGSNIKYQLQAVFEAAFDDKSAKQVEQMYDKMAKRVADSSRQEFVAAFQEFGTILNNALQHLNIQPIDINKLIELPNAQMFSQLGVEFGTKFTEGFKSAASGAMVDNLELENLRKEQQRLVAEREKAQNNIKNKIRVQELNTFDPYEATPLKVNGDVVAEAEKLLGELKMISDEIYNMQMSNKTQTQEYVRTVLDAQEKLNNFYRMRQTLLTSKTAVPKPLSEEYGLVNDDKIFAYSEKGDTINYAFEDISDAVIDASTDLQVIDNQLLGIEQRINSIVQASKNASGSLASGILGGNVDIEQARQRMQNKNGKTYNAKKVKELSDLTSDSPSHIDDSLEKLKFAYDKSVAEQQGWEVEYQWLAKFVQKYDELLSKGSNKKQLADFAGIYETFMGQYPEAMSKLRELRDVVSNTPASKKSRSDDNQAVSAEVSNTERLADANHRAAEEAERKVKAEEEAATLSQRQRTEAEATAQSMRVEAEQAERVAQSMVATEHNAKNAYVTGGVLDNPAFANMFKKTSTDDASAGTEQVNQSLATQSDLLSNIERLTSYIDEEYLSAGKHLSHFLNDLQTQSIKLDGELKQILTTLHLIDESGNLTFAIKQNGEQGGGTTHNGALISDMFTMIERSGYQRVKDSRLPASTQKAYQEGVNVAQVLDYIPSKTVDAFFDVQSTAKGHNLFQGGMLSQDVVNATEAQLQQLVNAFVAARNHGFDIENGGSNIVYDQNKGFSFYDLEEWSPKETAAWNALPEAKKRMRALNDALSIFGQMDGENLNRDYTNWSTDPNRMKFVEKFKQAIGRDASFKGLPYQDLFGYVFDEYYDENNNLKKKNESQTHQGNTAAINAETQAQEKLNQAKTQQAQIEQSDNDGAEVAEENAKTDALNRQNGALQENINLRSQANGQGTGTGAGTGTTPTKVTPTQTIPNGATSAEATSLDVIKMKLAEVTEAVNTKTNAFTNEEVEVKRVVTSEISSLDLLEQKMTTIKGTLEGLLSNLRTGSGDVGAGLGNITVTVNKNDAVDTEQQGAWALDTTLQSVKGTLDGIRSDIGNVINAISNINTKALSTDVGNIPATENTLVAIKGVLDAINGKVQAGVGSKGTSGTTASSDNGAMVRYENGTNAHSSSGGGQRPTEQINTALTSLLKYKTTLQEANQLSGDLEVGINNLYTELSQVSDKTGLSTWNEHFKQFKNASAILQTLVKDYQALGQAQARAAMETDPMRQMQYLDDAQIIQDRIATKSVDVNVGDDRFEEARQRAYAITRHELQQRQEIANARQTEVERTNAENAALREQEGIVQRLNRMYQEYGALRERAGGMVGANESSEISSQAEARLSEINDLRRSLTNITPEMERGFADSTDIGRRTEAMKQYQALARKSDQDEATRRKNILKLEQEIGNYRAKLDGATNAGVRSALEQEIQFREQLIALQQRGLAMDAQSESYYRKTYADRTKQAETLAKQEQRDQAKVFKDAIAQSQKEAGKSRASSVLSRADTTFNNAAQLQGITPAVENKLMQYKSQIDSLNASFRQVASGDGVVSEAQKAELIQQTNSVDRYTQEIQELIANYQRLSGPNAQSLNATSKLGFGATAEDYQKELTTAVQSFHKGRASIKSYDAETKTLTYTLKTGKGEFTQYAASVRQTDGALMSVRGTTTKAMGVFESVAMKVKQFSYYFTGSMMIYRVIGWVKQGVTAVKELDSAMTELKKVTDETEETYDKFLDTASKIGNKVGSTMKDVVSSTADWARLGYTMEEAAQFAESTQVLMNVSEFTDVSKATDSLISSIQAFKYTAEESMGVVDILNEIGNNYAISTSDLAESLTKSSGSLVAANGTLEEAVALTATANTIIQDSDVVGTALKTIAMRLRGTSVKEMEEEGLETDGAVTSKSKLQSKVKGLSGVDILTDTGAYKSTYQILSEIADVWEDISDIDQAALLELLAGKRGGSVMAAILQNPETLKDAFESASDASGSALVENEKYMDSIQGRIDQFNNSLQTMWNNELNSDVIKWFVGLVKVLIETIDKIGLLGSAFIVVSLAIMKMNKMNLVEYFGSISKSILNLGTKLKGYAAGVVSSMTSTAAATDVATVSSFKNAMAVAKVDSENKKAILSQMGLTNATNAQVISQNTLSASTLSAMVAEGRLTQAQADTIMSLLGIKVATNEVNAARLNEMLISQGLDHTQRSQIITSLGLGKSTQALTRAQVVQALATAGLDKNQKAAILSMLGLDVTTKGLTGSIAALWTALWPVLAVMAGIALLYGVVKLFDSMHDSAKELGDELQNLRSDISDIESDIDSINSELETMYKRIEELNALPSLSLTDQEELKRLQAQTAELERQKQIKENTKKTIEDKERDVSKDYINSAWNSSGVDKAYYVDGSGKAHKDEGWGGFWHSGQNTKDILEDSMSNYKIATQAKEYRDMILAADSYDINDDGKVDYKEYDMQYYARWGKHTDQTEEEYYKTYGESGQNAEMTDGQKRFLESSGMNGLNWDDVIQTSSENINLILGDEKFEDMHYGDDPKINAFLDELYAYQLKWQQLQGDYVKSTGISSMFDDTATDEMKNLGKDLKEIADDDILTNDQKNKKIIDRIGNIDKTDEAYARLKTTMETLGVTAEDIADYFVLETGEFDSNTVEGVTAQYARALNVMNQVKGMNSDGLFTVDGVEYDWDNFFSENDEGKFEARVHKFSEILKGMDDDTRKTFMSLSEKVKNGELTWTQAIDSFSHAGNLAGLKVIEAQIVELNNVEFKNITDEISGVIDTFGELSAALDDVASSMELLNTAQTQMNNAGRISVKTALEIMQSTDQWNEILEIEDGNIRLVGDATEILVENKLALIKSNLQNALATVTEQLAMIESQEASDDLATTMEESTNQAVRKLAGSMAYLTVMTEAYTRAANGQQIDVNSYMERAKDKQEEVEKELNWKLNSANKTTKVGLEERKAEIEAQLSMLDGIDTASEFKNNYDFDKTPGDKYNDDGGDDNRLANLQKKYEGKISNLENQNSWLENEIAREEEIGLGVSKSYYEKKISIEEKLIDEYEKERAELIELQKLYPEGSEKWYEVANAIFEVEHNMQESTKNIIANGKEIIAIYDEIFSKIGEAYDDKISISDDRIASMQNYAEILELQGGTATKGLYDAMIAENQGKMATQWEQFYEKEDIIAKLSVEVNPHEEGTDEWEAFELAREQGIIAASAEQRQLKLDIQETEKSVLQLKEEFKELATQAWDSVQEAYGNRDQYYQNQIDLNDKYISKLETLGINVPDEAYAAQIDSLEAASESKLEQYLQARAEMLDYESIYGADSQEYIDKYNETIQLHHEHLDLENEVLAKQQLIFDNQIDRFNQVIDRINNATQRMQNISSLLEDEDVATEDGEWTAEGLTRLGMAYQQMEYYKQSADEIADKMNEVEKAYKRGEISEKKYYETMQALEEQQWSAINSYEDMKDAIVDIAEARIDMIEEGINKEIEAYQEIIDLKKEELDAERDLYDFRKDVQKQTKDIAALERKIASMSGSTDASTIAERTKLEAQLREAKEGFNDTYYSHGMDSMSDAFDDEIEAYEKSANDYIESLRESIKDTEWLIENICIDVMANADIVLSEINRLSGEYGFTIDSNLTDPWVNAAHKATNFKETVEGLGSILGEGGIVTAFGSEETQKKLSGVFDAGSKAALGFENATKTHIGNIYAYVNGDIKGKLEKSLGDPYTKLSTDAAGNPLYEYSEYAKEYAVDKVIEHAKTNQEEVKSSLTGGFEQAKSSIQGWGTAASNAVDSVIKKFTGENGLLATLNKTADRINSMPTYDGGYTEPTAPASSPTSTPKPSSAPIDGGGTVSEKSGKYNANLEQLQKILVNVFNKPVGKTKSGGFSYTPDGIWGTTTSQSLKEAKQMAGIPLPNDSFTTGTKSAMQAYINKEKLKFGKGVVWGQKWLGELSKVSTFAKGTMGTTRDQLAITDESWIGEEITLAAGKNGQLQYLKKGSAVMPADISANLVEWGKLDPTMMNLGDMSGSIQLMSNYVNKPEIKLDIENFLNVGTVSKDTLPELEKLMDRKIDTFAKQLNASIRKFK